MPKIDQIEKDLRTLLPQISVAPKVSPVLPDLDPSMFLSPVGSREYQAAQAIRNPVNFERPATIPSSILGQAIQQHSENLSDILLQQAMAITGYTIAPVPSTEQFTVDYDVTEFDNNFEGGSQRHPSTPRYVPRNGPEVDSTTVVSRRSPNGRFEAIRPSAESLRQLESQRQIESRQVERPIPVTQMVPSKPSLPSPSVLDRILGNSPFDD